MSIYTTGLVYLGPARVIKEHIKQAIDNYEINNPFIRSFTILTISRKYNQFRVAFRLAFKKGAEDYYDQYTLKQRLREQVSEKDHLVSKNRFTSIMLQEYAILGIIRNTSDSIANDFYNEVNRIKLESNVVSALKSHQKKTIKKLRDELEKMYYFAQQSSNLSLRLYHSPERSYTA